jgi:hypothetical protein
MSTARDTLLSEVSALIAVEPNLTLADIAKLLQYNQRYLGRQLSGTALRKKIRNKARGMRYSKLNAAKHEEIRALRLKGKKLRELAEQFGVSHQMISQICSKGLK